MRTLLSAITLIACSVFRTMAADVEFRPQEIDKSLKVGYAVRILDVDGDGKKDIVVLDADRLIWFENPSWKLRTILQGGTKPDNVCFAPYDIDGDGKLDFAIGADWQPGNTKGGGSIQWLRQGESLDDPWTLYSIGEEPTTHRMEWADLDADGRAELILLPLKGRGSTKPTWDDKPLRVLSFKIPEDPTKDRWYPDVIEDELTVAHNFDVTDFDRDAIDDLLVASYEGVNSLRRDKSGNWHKTHLGEGNQKTKPFRGSSEVRHALSGSEYIATIEPWHGFQVVVYTPPPSGKGLWTRHVLDEQLKAGHAVRVANLDDDEDLELVIGSRDNKGRDGLYGVRVYDPVDVAAGKWQRDEIDPGGVAVEATAVGDLNEDGRPDIVAVGRKTKNVKIYWNEGK